MQNLKVTRTAEFAGATVTGLTNATGLMGTGRVFYVDYALGADGYGTVSQNPNYPLKTITAAMDICTASLGDAIVVMANSPSTPAATETFPIAMDVNGVLLVGLYHRGGWGGGDSGFSSDEVNGDTISATANYCNIENLYLGVDSAGTTGCPITATGAYNLTVRNCHIEGQTTGLYGIEIAGDCPWLLVEDCGFGASHATYLTSGMYIVNATRGMVRRNTFYRCTSYAVHIGANCHGGVSILDNKFHLSADTKGFAVYVASGALTNFIDGNHASHGYNDPSTNPYLDLTGAATTNNWGINYKGVTATAPAIA